MKNEKIQNNSFHKILELQNLIIKESSLRRLCNNLFIIYSCKRKG